MTNTYDLFKVRNFDRTAKKHAVAVDNMQTRFKELGLDYHDILDSDAWQAVDSEVESRLSIWQNMNLDMTRRSIARLINSETRQVIIRSLKWHNLPKSWDTAFFVANYMKVIEGMAEILENIEARRA